VFRTKWFEVFSFDSIVRSFISYVYHGKRGRFPSWEMMKILIRDFRYNDENSTTMMLDTKTITEKLVAFMMV
jgi:hypothetical protein